MGWWALGIFVVVQGGLMWFVHWAMGPDSLRQLNKGILLLSTTLASVPFFLH